MGRNTERGTRNRLTAVAFETLLSSLAEDRDAAADEYLRLRVRLIRYFEVRGFAVADDAADEVLDRLARKLTDGSAIEVPGTYALGIARMLTLELRKSATSRTINDLPEVPVTDQDPTQAHDKEKSLECLDRCLEELTGENRRLIVRYYESEKRTKIENRQLLAENLGVSSNALRNRAVRIRGKLEFCIGSCLNG